MKTPIAIRNTVRATVAAAAIAVLTFGTGAQPAHAGGIRNCVDLTGKQLNRVGCFENVWSGDVEYRMTFSTVTFSGSAPHDLEPFYVLAPQGAVAQGPVPTFPHDHVVRAIPTANAGTYTTRLQGFFVLCTEQGLVGGTCTPEWLNAGGGVAPFAKSVGGHALTSTAAIESAAADGDVLLVNLGPAAVIVGSIRQSN
ncbi:MAG TPA: hypothetical protein VFP56_10965 [Candidatus Limnocylindrales bacterium]|nr:hypothetical protein [Candidatus Limnocylindrales bacterium]